MALSNTLYIYIPNTFTSLTSVNSVLLSSDASYTLMVYVVFPGEGPDTFHDKFSCLAWTSLDVIPPGFCGTNLKEKWEYLINYYFVYKITTEERYLINGLPCNFFCQNYQLWLFSYCLSDENVLLIIKCVKYIFFKFT